MQSSYLQPTQHGQSRATAFMKPHPWYQPQIQLITLSGLTV